MHSFETYVLKVVADLVLRSIAVAVRIVRHARAFAAEARIARVVTDAGRTRMMFIYVRQLSRGHRWREEPAKMIVGKGEADQVLKTYEERQSLHVDERPRSGSPNDNERQPKRFVEKK